MKKNAWTEKDVDALISAACTEFQSLLKSEQVESVANESKTENKVENVVAEAATTAQVAEITQDLNKSEQPATEAITYTESEIKELNEMYASMSKSELEAHVASIQKIAGVPTTPSITPAPAAEPMAKSEALVKAEEENASLKTEIEKAKKENEELKKSFEMVTDALNKMVNKKPTAAPAQKAVTAMSYIAKSEETVDKDEVVKNLSKSEITNKIKALDYSSLSKSDRDSINKYYLENASVDVIKHLIK